MEGVLAFLFWLLIFYVLFSLVFNPVYGMSLVSGLLVFAIIILPVIVVIAFMGVMMALLLE